MEDVLTVYARCTLPGVARLCFDERPCQLLGDRLVPLPMQPGQTRKVDSEYTRHGTCVVLLAYDMERGQRYVQVRARRTKQDYAEFMDWLVSTHYPDGQKLLVVQDNLNTHTYGAFYEHLPSQRAFDLRQRIEFHFTPNHASWLNMAELEFAALVRQCLDRRLASQTELEHEVHAWQAERNAVATTIHWTFTVSDARHKLKRHYHAVNSNN
jgi:hypothetical protein